MPRPKAPQKSQRWTFSIPTPLLERLHAAAERLRSEQGMDVSSAEIVRRAVANELDELDRGGSRPRIPDFQRSSP